MFIILQIGTDEEELPVLKKRNWQNMLCDFLRYPLAAFMLNLTFVILFNFHNYEFVLRQKSPSFY